MKKLVNGLLFVMIGCMFLVASFLYPMGSVSAMGPGMFPSAISILLISIGTLMIFGK